VFAATGCANTLLEKGALKTAIKNNAVPNGMQYVFLAREGIARGTLYC
jgi:hypothetical protein